MKRKKNDEPSSSEAAWQRQRRRKITDLSNEANPKPRAEVLDEVITATNAAGVWDASHEAREKQMLNEKMLEKGL